MAADLAFSLAGIHLEKLGSFTYQEICMARGMKHDLKKFHQTTLLLKDKLLDAEKQQERREALKHWLVRLEQVLDDAVDVLDEFKCEVLRRKVVREYGSVGRKGTTDTTHSFVNPSDVIGRDDDKAEIIDMLMSKQENTLPVILIVGIGGLKNTTLAKSVYNDQKVVERFDLRLWVCVSSDFSVAQLAREILKPATDAGQDLSNLSPDQLQRPLRGTLEGKRFLLVLDDVWNDDRSKWIELRDLLIGGAEGRISCIYFHDPSQMFVSLLSFDLSGP